MPDMKFEFVVLPVANADRSKKFYSDIGWKLDMDFERADGYRVIQFTPPGSGTSIIFGRGITTAEPGSARALYLVVSDIVAARSELVSRGATVSDVFHDAGGVFHHAGGKDRVDGIAPERRSYGTYAEFSDPDGNGWLLQEVTTRLPGHGSEIATTFSSATEFAAALRRAQSAQREREKQTGHQIADWTSWYADYIVSEQSGKPVPA